MWQLTIAAVSVLNLLLPSETAEKPCFRACSISFGLKSPSGPTKIQIGFFFDKTFFRSFFSQLISQKIIFPLSGKFFRKFSKP